MIAGFERRLAQEITHPVFGYQLSYRRLLDVQGRLLGRHLLGEIPELPAVEPR
jgi:CRISPR-associated protein Cas1